MGYQSNTYQEPYLDPQQAALSQSSQDPQLADSYSSLLASEFDQPCVEVALDDDGADEDGDGGVSFAASILMEISLIRR